MIGYYKGLIHFFKKELSNQNQIEITINSTNPIYEFLTSRSFNDRFDYFITHLKKQHRLSIEKRPEID